MNELLSRREMLRKSAGFLAASAMYPLATHGAEAGQSAVYLPSLYTRACLAIHGLVEHADASRGYLPYFYTRMSDRPPTMFLTIWSYGDGLGRSVDALTLLRQLAGESLDQPADRAMLATLIGLLGVDGLSWCPAEPWLLPVPHMRPTWLQQGTLMALTTLHQVTGDAQYRQLVEKNIEGLTRLLVRQPQGWFCFPGDVYTRAKGWEPPPKDPMHPFSLFCSSSTMPLLRYYSVTRYEPALKLASDLMVWALQEHDGGQKLFNLGHFHCQSRVITSLLLRGILRQDPADLLLGEMLYKKARALGTQSGWFPEQINNPDNNRSNLSETCCLTDMLEAAILLARHHDPVYWHDAERYVRNHLLVHQITDVGWVAEMTPTPLEKHPLNGLGDGLQTTGGVARGDKVMPTLLGGFAGWGAVTAMSDNSPFSNSNQHCCNAAGARAIYDAWRYAVTDEEGVFQVNLHVHRSHAVAEIVSAEVIQPHPTLPFGGAEDVARLQIRMKQSRDLRVRIPEFVGIKEMLVRVNDRPITPREDRAFLALGPVRPGDRVEVFYPLKSRTSEERIAPGVFRFHWRGATVVSASPEQKIRPLFTDARFSTSPPPIGSAPIKEFDSL